MAHRITPDYVLTDDSGQELGNLIGVDVGALDLVLDVLFLIGQVLVGRAIALDVGLLLQEVERLGNLPVQFGEVLAEVVIQEHGEVAWGGREVTHVLHQEQCLEQPDRHVAHWALRKLCLRRRNIAGGGGLHRLPDAGEHGVEGHHRTEWEFLQVRGDFLHDPQH